MKIEKNVIRIDNLIVNASFLNNNKYNDQYCVYENELFCFNAHPFLEHYSDIKITQEMLLNILHRAQQKNIQEIEEDEKTIVWNGEIIKEAVINPEDLRPWTPEK